MVGKRMLHAKQRRMNETCMTCANAHLMQWGNDPIISQCRVSGQREVASAPLPTSCNKCYRLAQHLPLEIEHFKKRGGRIK